MKQLTSGNQTIESFSISPHARTLAYDSNLNGNQDIFLSPVSGGEPEQLTHNHRDNFAPDWSPDGSKLVYHTLENGSRDLYIVDAAGGIALCCSGARVKKWAECSRATVNRFSIRTCPIPFSL